MPIPSKFPSSEIAGECDSPTGSILGKVVAYPSKRNARRVTSGDRFGRLSVLFRHGSDKERHAVWVCRCDCGVTREVSSHNLNRGYTRSCGCLVNDTNKGNRNNFKHGHTREHGNSPTYTTWQRMKQRCQYPKMQDYPHYGGRGIKVCNRWQSSFENFLADMGERPSGKTIDRIDVDGDYEPSNCRWATASEQELNKRTSSSTVERRVANAGVAGSSPVWCCFLIVALYAFSFAFLAVAAKPHRPPQTYAQTVNVTLDAVMFIHEQHKGKLTWAQLNQEVCKYMKVRRTEPWQRRN